MRKALLILGALAVLVCFACAKKAEMPMAEKPRLAAPTPAEEGKTDLAMKEAGSPAMPTDSSSGGAGSPTGKASDEVPKIPPGDAAAVAGELKLIKTASIRSEVGDVDAGFEEVYKVARAEKALVVGTTRSVAEEGYAFGSVTIKVTPEKYDETIRALRKIGRLMDENSSTEDVTAEYVDLKARLDNAEASRARYLEILNTKSATVPDILAVEREIERVTENIERLKGEMRLIESRVGLSTITVNLEEPHTTMPGGYRFAKAMKSAVRIAIYICIFIIQAIIVLLPFIVLLIIILLVVRAIIWYFQKRRKRAKEAVAGKAGA